MKATRSYQVLIAEPDTETRDAVAQALTEEGADPVVAFDAKSALRLAETIPFCATVIDLRLPDLSGLLLFHYLRRMRPVPALFIGASASKEIRLQVADAGAWSFLPRPFTHDVARLTIQVFAKKFLSL